MPAPTSPQPNRLAHETSPYLLSHAHNPVDWHPWGPEALTTAKRENKPILLSIGYAACHWCHVMERESFENDATARLMNDHFVCIKVDREERPDLDDIYMAATVAMTGHGGWPMTVFLTPDQEPFFAGTYFPPEDSQGRPGFPTLLSRIAELWATGKDNLVEQAKDLTEHVRSRSELLPARAVGAEALDGALAQLEKDFDPDYGGFGGAPKFPPPASLSLLLRIHRKKKDPKSIAMVERTLDSMKNGGIYDHVGGGFSRYSTDERWLVPHFEKMLYDNAQLARVYLEAFQVTGVEEYRRVATETLDYVAREMQSPEGGYYSATDADSEGVEGKFFVFSPDEIREILEPEAAERFSEYFDITPDGNWEGHSIPNTPRSLQAVASELGVSPDELRRSLAEARQKVYAARLRRVPPLTDDKVLAAWNGLMIGAFADGARVLGEKRYLDSAERAARFVLRELARPDGGLYRTARAGKAHLDAYLEDYAFVADALVDLYEAGAPESHLHEALRLAERMLTDFGDEGGALFHTARKHETLIARSREGHDGATPNANAVAARVLARLAFHFDRHDLHARALDAIRAYGRPIERAPRAFATTLGVVDLLLEAPIELAFVGAPGSPDLAALLAEVARHYLPNRIVAHAEPGPDHVARSALPLLAEKRLVDGVPALYVCRNFTCRAPVSKPAEVAVALEEVDRELDQARALAVGAVRLAGTATPEGTSSYAARFAEARGTAAYGELAKTGLVASALGFGTYRVDDRVDEHREALTRALSSGINVIDTSTNYADGHSERLIGEVLEGLSRTSGSVRSEVVVVSKIGYVQGANLRIAEEREANGRPFPEMVKYAEGLSHCIHPEWLEDQLGRSLDRLRLDALDVCLLHNPEYFLGDAERRGVSLEAAQDEFYRRIGDAFRHFEAEVRRGRIRYYGVSSNTAAEDPADPEATSLTRFLEQARTAGGDDHHFRVLQLPMNLIETGAAFVHNNGVENVETVLEHARRRNVAVLVNRPLNAIVDDRLARLADPPTLPDAPRLSEALDRVRQLEREFGTTFAPSIRMAPESRVQSKDLLQWATRLGDIASNLKSLEEWQELEARAVGPRVLETIGALDRAFPGPAGERWVAFRERYLAEIEGLLASITSRAADRSRARAIQLSLAVDPLLPAESRSLPLSQKALLVLCSTPGVTSVLVGMRDPDYVEDAIAMMGLPRIADVEPVLEASSAVELR